MVSPQAVMEWDVSGFEALTERDFGFIESLKPEIVILGTGAAQRFPRQELSRALTAAGVGVEIMDSRAACRTYNILMSDGRRVAAALLMIEKENV